VAAGGEEVGLTLRHGSQFAVMRSWARPTITALSPRPARRLCATVHRLEIVARSIVNGPMPSASCCGIRSQKVVLGACRVTDVTPSDLRGFPAGRVAPELSEQGARRWRAGLKKSGEILRTFRISGGRIGDIALTSGRFRAFHKGLDRVLERGYTYGFPNEIGDRLLRNFFFRQLTDIRGGEVGVKLPPQIRD
jgi:hypothetical protein